MKSDSSILAIDGVRFQSKNSINKIPSSTGNSEEEIDAITRQQRKGSKENAAWYAEREGEQSSRSKPFRLGLATPVEGTITGSCHSVKCTFLETSCSWRFGSNWYRTEGSLIIDREGEDLVESAFFTVPIGAFLEMDISMSEDARLTIAEGVGENYSVIWTRTGFPDSNGWHRLRIPLHPSNYPSKVWLKAKLPSNSFIAVSNAKLVNGEGNELGCGTNSSSIQSKYLEPERLTAYQQIQSESDDSTQRLLPVISTTPTLMPVIGKPTSRSLPKNYRIRPQTFQHSHGILQHSAFSTNNVVLEPLPGGVPSLKEGSISVTGVEEPSSAMNVLKSKQLEKKDFSFINRPPISQEQQLFPTSANMQPLPSVAVMSTNTQEQVNTSNISSLISRIGGQPLLEGQLRLLARQFGFDQLNGQQTLELLKRLLSTKMSGSVTDTRTDEEDIVGIKNPISYLQPIKPVNAPVQALSALIPGSLSTLSSLKQSSENINAELLKRIASILSLPTTQLDSQRPLTRQNLDFIVQNANSS